MRRSIEQVLNQRADLSPFLVHLTSHELPAHRAIDKLGSMLHGGVIEARNPHGWAKNVIAAPDTQKVVCFSETPLAEVSSLTNIANRRVNLEPCGLVFDKVVARQKGALPVWYIDADSEQKIALDDLQQEAWSGRAERPWEDHPAAKLFPFFESMGSWPNAAGGRTTKEFSWEREWRHRGDFAFDRATELALILAPEEWHPWLTKHYGERPCIDVDWTLDRKMAALVGR